MSGIRLITLHDLPARVASGHERATSRLVHEAAADGRASVAYCEVDPGGRAEAHSHSGAEQVFVVLQGELDISGEQHVRAGADQAVLVAAGASHAVVNNGSSVARYIALTVHVVSP